MTDQHAPVPQTDYRIYLGNKPPVEDILKEPNSYRLMMLFPDDPMDMEPGALFDKQEWLYSDKEWLFYEDRSGELVKAPNTPENQPGNWRIEATRKEVGSLSQLLGHRLNASQRKLMGMADRGVPEPEKYSQEEDKLETLVSQKEAVQATIAALNDHNRALRPMVIASNVKALLDDTLGTAKKNVDERDLEPTC